ncbi:MAG: GAF domain-containing protein [Hydrogenophilales bacterium]|nr:GAF domain-containing protein [Hydrogenophilales bacterium]
MWHGSLLARLEQLISIGIDLSGQNDVKRILGRILDAAMDLTQADGGTLYLVDAGRLNFSISRNRSLGFELGGAHGDALSVEPIPLVDSDGSPNLGTVATAAANQKRTINLTDAYSSTEFDFSGTRRFDAHNNYRSQSFLTVPLINHEAEVIGVLQLINAIDKGTGVVTVFDRDDQYLVESLASQAAVVLDNRRLIDRLEDLFFAFIKVINIALDEKSHYTHGHCQRVPPLTMMLAEAVDRSTSGPFKDFVLADAMRRELDLAALMHDCGKITTPVHVVDKATKLEAIHDRIHLVDTRFEVLKRDARIELLEAGVSGTALETRHREICARLDSELDLLRQANVGGEAMGADELARIRAIADRYRWQDPSGATVPLLSEEEVDKLCIERGTLSSDERAVINHHIDATLRMLEALPWPKHLSHVPEYAGGHHERIDGKGYPRGLTGEQMSIPARIMAIADVFEALTARDRPYKKGKTLSEALAILGRMKLDKHIDPDLFDVFIRERVYLRYAERYLEPEQIDEPDEAQIPGYHP